jgi:hypothetical protein
MFRSEAFDNLAAGVPEVDVVGKQTGAVCNRDQGVPEEDVFGKKDAAVRLRNSRIANLEHW